MSMYIHVYTCAFMSCIHMYKHKIKAYIVLQKAPVSNSCATICDSPKYIVNGKVLAICCEDKQS